MTCIEENLFVGYVFHLSKFVSLLGISQPLVSFGNVNQSMKPSWKENLVSETET